MASAVIRFSIHVAKSSVLVPIGIGRSSGEINERRASRMSLSVPGRTLTRFFILLRGARSRRGRLNVELPGRLMLGGEFRVDVEEHESSANDYFNYRSCF